MSGISLYFDRCLHCGIVSWGPEDCEGESVFTQTSSYADWIRETMSAWDDVEEPGKILWLNNSYQIQLKYKDHGWQYGYLRAGLSGFSAVTGCLKWWRSEPRQMSLLKMTGIKRQLLNLIRTLQGVKDSRTQNFEIRGQRVVSLVIWAKPTPRKIKPSYFQKFLMAVSHVVPSARKKRT